MNGENFPPHQTAPDTPPTPLAPSEPSSSEVSISTAGVSVPGASVTGASSPARPKDKPSLSQRLVASYNTSGGRIMAGILASNAAGALVCALVPSLLAALSRLAGEGVSGAATFTLSIGLPMSIGVVAAYFWRDMGRFESPAPPLGPVWSPSASGPLPPAEEARTREYESPESFPMPPRRSRERPGEGEMAWLTLANSVVSLLPAFLVLHEGVICLMMAFPLLWLLNWVGTLLGLAIWRSLRKLQVSLVPLLFLLPALDLALASTGVQRLYRGRVTTQVTIRAQPAQVYRYLAAFPPIEGQPDGYWLWRIGAPPPRVSRAQGAFVGAYRECVLGTDKIIRERVTRAEPGRELAFRVTQMPNDPEIIGHLYLFEGGFQIVPQSDGTCQLVGHTTYGLATRPGWYYDWWAQSVIHAVHRRVLNHIRDLAEHDRARNERHQGSTRKR